MSDRTADAATEARGECFTDEIARLTQEKEAAEERAKERYTNILHLNACIRYLEKVIDDGAWERNDFDIRVTRMIHNHRVELEQYEIKLKQANGTAEIEELKIKYAVAFQTVQDLEKEREEKDKRIKNLESLCKGFIKETEGLKKAAEQAKEAAQAAEQEKVDLQARLTSLQQVGDTATAERKEKEAMKNQVATLKTTIGTKDKEIAFLKHQLQQRATREAERNSPLKNTSQYPLLKTPNDTPRKQYGGHVGATTTPRTGASPHAGNRTLFGNVNHGRIIKPTGHLNGASTPAQSARRPQSSQTAFDRLAGTIGTSSPFQNQPVPQTVNATQSPIVGTPQQPGNVQWSGNASSNDYLQSLLQQRNQSPYDSPNQLSRAQSRASQNSHMSPTLQNNSVVSQVPHVQTGPLSNTSQQTNPQPNTQQIGDSNVSQYAFAQQKAMQVARRYVNGPVMAKATPEQKKATGQRVYLSCLQKLGFQQHAQHNTSPVKKQVQEQVIDVDQLQQAALFNGSQIPALPQQQAPAQNNSQGIAQDRNTENPPPSPRRSPRLRNATLPTSENTANASNGYSNGMGLDLSQVPSLQPSYGEQYSPYNPWEDTIDPRVLNMSSFQGIASNPIDVDALPQLQQYGTQVHPSQPNPTKPTNTNKRARSATPAAPSEPKGPFTGVACTECYFNWRETWCDENEPCENCVSSGNAQHCERPPCEHYNNAGECTKKKCTRAHMGDGYQNLAMPRKDLKRKGKKGDDRETPPKRRRYEQEGRTW